MRTDFKSLSIPKKDYDIFVGKPFSDVTTVQYIFDGWTDELEKATYHSDLSDFEVESSAGRVMPLSPVARAIQGIVSWKDSSAQRASENDVWPPVGTIFDVTYWHDKATPDEIESYFHSHGIALHRASPFIKPHMTLWQVMKDMFAKK
jgi:hypothetical protein